MFTLVSFQMTAFTNLSVDSAKAFAKSLGPDFNKQAIPVTPFAETPLFRVTANDKSQSFDISQKRIDCFYSEYAEKNIKDFVAKLRQIPDLGKISRLAINYTGFVPDEDEKVILNLNKKFGFEKLFGDTCEIMFRTNNRKQILELTFNEIVECQNSIMQNSSTLDEVKSVTFHFDINNVPVDEIKIEKVESFFDLMYKELEEKINTCCGIVNE